MSESKRQLGYAFAMFVTSLVLVFCIDVCSENNINANKATSSNASYATESNKEEVKINNVQSLKETYNYESMRHSPIYNVSQQCAFTVNFKTSETLPDDAVAVYMDASCVESSKIDTLNYIEKNIDSAGQCMEIKPYETVMSLNNSKGWGNAPIYFIKIQYDLESEALERLSKPIIIPFKTSSSVKSPVLRSSIEDNGIFKLTWDAVEKADSYKIYKVNTSYIDGETASITGYRECNPVLVAEVATTGEPEYAWYDWNNNNTNGIGAVSGEATIYENFGLATTDEYYITAVVGDTESKFSNPICLKDYADIITVKIKDDSLLKPGEYIQDVKDLPRSVNISTLNNDAIKYNVEYTIDETTRYNDNVYYNYKVNGTELKGYIEVKINDVISLPSSIKNGIGVYTDDYNIAFKVNQSTSEIKKSVNINEILHNCEAKMAEYNNEVIGETSVYLNNNVVNTAEDAYLTLKLLEYTKQIDLSAFESLQDSTLLEDKVLEILYQNPLIYGVKSLEYDEDTMTLNVNYSESIDSLRAKQREINNSVSNIIKNIEFTGDIESNIEQVYLYINHNYIYNKDSDLYSMIKDSTGNALAYSQLFKLMCNKKDIENKIISGSLNGKLHTWNAVKLGNDVESDSSSAYYYIDVTNNLKNIGFQRMCYNMSTAYAKKIGYLSNNKSIYDADANKYKSASDEYEYYNKNKLVANNYDEYIIKVKEGLRNERKVITVRYTGEEIKSSQIVSGVSEVFKEADKELMLGKLKFGDGGGYYVLWFEAEQETEAE